MKKIIILLIVCLFTLCGCEKNNKDIKNNIDENNSISKEETIKKLDEIAYDIYVKGLYKSFDNDNDLYSITAEDLIKTYEYDLSFLSNVDGKSCNMLNIGFYVNLKNEAEGKKSYYAHFECD